MQDKLKKLIEEEINPVLNQHLGFCELEKIEDGVAHIKLGGTCKGCPGKRFTFNKHIIPYLKENIDGLKDVKLL